MSSTSQEGGIGTYKLMFLALLLLVVVCGLMFLQDGATRDFWVLSGFLGAIVLVTSLLEIRRNPDMFLEVAAVTALAAAIFTGTAAAYTKNRTAALVTAAAAVVALGLGAWSYHRKRQGPRPAAKSPLPD